MRPFLAAAALAALAAPAAAQQRPAPKAPPPPKEAPPPDATAGALFPCRSDKEVCYVGVAREGKLVVLFTNDPKGEEISGKPVAVTDGSADLAKSEGKVVMLVGSLDPKTGLARAEIVDVASPLVAFAIKSAVGGGGGDEPPPPPAPPPKRR
ncbi:hypothetical protein [Methylobacterium oryzisoli]|uniref:hypothetical protein n=2 Tax=Methylobacterium oryzisoli TaxID=3385502 RepID=UPI00389181F0